MGLPNGNDGKPLPAQLGAGGGFIPKAWDAGFRSYLADKG
jgi:hypothetical protein